MTSPAEPVQLGLRERNKRDRRLRIELAALDVFREKGFDAATTREIADRAGVGVATLFGYARDKSDLLLMVFNERLEAITERGADGVDPRASLVDQLVELFRPRYDVWGEDPHLSRYAIQQSVAIPEHAHAAPGLAARFHARRARLIETIVSLVERKQCSGAVNASIDAQLAAGMILDIYLSETNAWVVTVTPDINAGLERLRLVLSLAAVGLNV